RVSALAAPPFALQPEFDHRYALVTGLLDDRRRRVHRVARRRGHLETCTNGQIDELPLAVGWPGNGQAVACRVVLDPAWQPVKAVLVGDADLDALPDRQHLRSLRHPRPLRAL